MSERWCVNKRDGALALGDWSGVLGEEIPAEVIDALPVGRIETLERVRLAKKLSNG